MKKKNVTQTRFINIINKPYKHTFFIQKYIYIMKNQQFYMYNKNINNYNRTK